MKELTIEQKAEAYDLALERAKKLYEQGTITESLSYVFPELRESEDERIRKALICHISKISTEIPVGALHRINGVDIPDILAWLEKQGNPTDINPSEFDLRLNKLLKQFETLPKEELASSLSFYLNVVQNDGTYREEKQGEQNLVDKVEPKFKVGEWITNGCDTWKIVEVKPLAYILQSQDGKIEDDTISYINETYDSFTIEDAEDGDVLFMDNGSANCIFIYKSFNNGIINKYASYNTFGFEGKHYLVLNDGYVIPATKEQRDTLFAKMKEAGYEWDAEERELKKISQRMISAEAKEAMYGKPTAWSENDEYIIERLSYLLDNEQENYPQLSCDFQEIQEFKDWLKSLKQRIGG